MRIYIASPLGFAASTRGFLPELIAAVRTAGFEPVDPWSLPKLSLLDEAERLPPGAERLQRFKEADHLIGAANEEALRSCDCVLAVLDGVDVDSGTASEAGFAYGLGKTIVGLRTDFRRAGENEGAIVNLQVQYWIEKSGGSIGRDLEELGAILRSLVTTGDSKGAKP